MIIRLPEQWPAKHENQPDAYMHKLPIQLLNIAKINKQINKGKKKKKEERHKINKMGKALASKALGQHVMSVCPILIDCIEL